MWKPQRRIVKQAKRLAGLKHRVRRIGLRVDSMRSRLKIVELKTPLDHHCPPTCKQWRPTRPSRWLLKKVARPLLSVCITADTPWVVAMLPFTLSVVRRFALANVVQCALQPLLLAIQRHALRVSCRIQRRRKSLDIEEKTAPAHAAGLSWTPAAWACSSAW